MLKISRGCSSSVKAKEKVLNADIMSVYIDSKRFAELPTTDIQILPCEICCDGDASVSTHLKLTSGPPSICYVNNTTGAVTTTHAITSPSRPSESYSSSSFRGRPLCGKSTEVPEGFAGVVLKESCKPFSEDEDRVVSVEKKFDSLMYWKLDGEPSNNDVFIKALDWIAIAEAIHSDVGAEDPETPSSVDGLR
ncbi:uncharacterized protein LOC117113107 [Anneissia japonica]|uniref:uncharacterized protein LOC117113107 n=1 Tax=Anneissia japonica TaxID=1529436 RepID=UPI001425B342|nr:uncharacterized protein LOC117113107 [Anneissia japonica]